MSLLVSDGPGPSPPLQDDPDPKPEPGPGPDGNPALDFIIGLSDGLFDDHTFTECVANVLQAAPQAESALSDLVEALKSKNPLKIAKAVKEFKQVIKSIPDSLKACSDNIQDVEELLNKLEEVVPAFNHDIAQAFDSLKAKDYEDFGEYTGKALRFVIYGDEPHATNIIV